MKLDDTSDPFPLRRVLLLLGVGVLIVTLCAYILYQARFIILGPQIVLFHEYSPLQTTRVVTLEGQMFNIVQASLNGRTIYTDERGNFNEALILENGYTIATLEAEDRYGRTTTIQAPFVYRPQSLINQ